MWNEAWDKIFRNNEWGKYPPEHLIRFIARNYYNVPNRNLVNILEMGSGTGANLWYLAREGFSVSGIDGSSVGVGKAIKRLNDERLKADIIVGEIMKLPYPDNAFDCVIDNECLYANSYKDAKKILSEAHRVLRSKGKLLSATFMTGMSGDGFGKHFEGEIHTYTKLDKGPFSDTAGITRFTSEAEITDLYGMFNIDSIDYVIRSDKNRAYDIKEWIIVCSKK